MDVFSTIEDAIIAEAFTRLGGKIRVADSLPGPWSIDLLRELAQNAPGVYVSLISGKSTPNNSSEWIFAPSFDVYFVAVNAAGEKARRRGDSTSIGAYEMMQTLGPYLHGLNIPDIGCLKFAGLSNLFGEPMRDVGGTIYALKYDLEKVHIEKNPADFDALIDFETYTAAKSVPGGDGEEPEAIDLVTLDQTPEP